MSNTKADVLKKATELEPKLRGKLFLGGSKPSAEDVKEFNALLGAGNINLYRWLKNIASFTEDERKTWGAPYKTPAPAAAAAAPKKEEKKAEPKAAEAKPAAPAVKSPAAAPKPAPKAPAADDDDVDLFGEETEEETAALAAKKKAEEEKKAAKKVVIAKSSILLDVKPWEDTTNMQELVEKVKAEVIDGLVWGAHKFITVAYGLKKLQILFVIEDDKVSSEDIEDLFTVKYEEYVQSIDIVAWNKI